MKIRIIAPAIVIGLATGAAGHGGSSSALASVLAGTSSSTAAATPVASRTRTKPAVKPASRTTPRKLKSAAVTVPAHRARHKATVPAHLVGRRLDIAERMLHTAGVRYKVIALHGHLKGATRQWGVCEPLPGANGSEWSPAVDLLVAPHRCGGR